MCPSKLYGLGARRAGLSGTVRQVQWTSTGNERRGAAGFMTFLQALAILEAAVLECKKRNVNTPEVKEALDFFEPYIWPKRLIPQFRYHVENQSEPLENREG